MGKVKRTLHVIDATGKAPGRLGTEIAKFLMGKHKVSYTPEHDRGDKVLITNAAKVLFTGKKLEQMDYKHHSMYPGGLKSVLVSKVMRENPQEVIRHAVIKMLPKNKLRAGRMLRLKFE